MVKYNLKIFQIIQKKEGKGTGNNRGNKQKTNQKIVEVNLNIVITNV